MFSYDPFHDGALYEKMSPICPERLSWAPDEYSRQSDQILENALSFLEKIGSVGYNCLPFTKVTGHELDDFIEEKKAQQEEKRINDLKQRLKQAKEINSRKK